MKLQIVGALLALVLAAPELRAIALLPVIDLHVDLPYRSGYKGAPFAEGSGQFRASELLASGLSGVVLPLFVPRDATPQGRTKAEFEASYARVFSSILQQPPYALPGCEVKQAGGSARQVTTWLSFEGAEPIEPSLQELAIWSLRGVRLFGLVHSQHNRLASSSGEPSTGKGLSARGREFAIHVLELGGVLDVSHASDESTDELIALAQRAGRPIVASHSNARALAPHPRNLTDAQIRAIAQTGGVIGVNFHQAFLAKRGRTATLADVVEQVRYLARLGGLGVVAIGSDFEGGIRPVRELDGAGTYQRLAHALGESGFSTADQARVLGGNALRVLCPAAKFARSAGHD